MRIMTRSALGAWVLVVVACGPSPDRTGEPQTPPPVEQTAMPAPMTQEPMTPAAGTGTTSEAATAEPTTPPEPVKQPLRLQHGETANEIQHVLLLKDPNKKQKDRLLFFNAHVSCDEIIAAKNKMPPSLVLATDVKMDGEVLQLAQPMKWTYYTEGKGTPINAKKEDILLTTETVNGRLTGTLKVATKIKNADLSGEGPFQVETCEAPQGQGVSGGAGAGTAPTKK